MNRRRRRELEHSRKVSKNVNAYWNFGSVAKQKRIDYRAGLIMRAVEMQEGIRVLELGCGTGEYSKRFASSGAEIVAVDVSPELVEIAKNNNARGNVLFKVGDAYNLSKYSNFDAVVGNAVLHHLVLGEVLPEVWKVLRVCGVAVFTEPNMANPQIFLQKNVSLLKELAGDSPDETAFYKQELRGNFERAGFSEVRVRNVDFTHPSLPLPLYELAVRVNPLFEWLPLVREVSGSLLVVARKQKEVGFK